MATRVIRIQGVGARDRRRMRHTMDPAGTALMVAISGTVLVLTLVSALTSTAAGGWSRSVAQPPEPAPPPTWAAPSTGGGQVSP